MITACTLARTIVVYTTINSAIITTHVQFINCITTVEKLLGWANWMQLPFS